MKRTVSLILFLITLLSLCSCSNDSWVTIDTFDIGKADCTLIDTGTKTVMIDTGESDDVADIEAYLDTKGVNSIDVLILSHSDKDHIGGAAELISSYDITTVLENGFSSKRDEYTAYHQVLEEMGFSTTVITEDYSFTVDSCTFTVYAPKETYYKTKEDNNSSLIVMMEYGERRLLFCGDAMEQRLSEFIADAPGSVDYVKLPYHGNYIENYADFLDEISPEYGVICCSDKNPPNDETIALLTQYGVQVHETRDGAVSVKTDGKSIRLYQ